MYDLPNNEHTIVLTTIPASVEACFAVGIDLEAYPEWVVGLSSVEVEERDETGRPLRARFLASGIGRQASYVLAYDLSGGPTRLSWSMVEGDLTSRLEGSYVFEPSTTDSEATDVTYELLIDLAVPLPGYVKRRAEDKIVEAALQRFRDRVVAVTGSGFPT